jgi:hypothetical protein
LGLQPGCKYSFAVCAVSSAGEGPASKVKRVYISVARARSQHSAYTHLTNSSSLQSMRSAHNTIHWDALAGHQGAPVPFRAFEASAAPLRPGSAGSLPTPTFTNPNQVRLLGGTLGGKVNQWTKIGTPNPLFPHVARPLSASTSGANLHRCIDRTESAIKTKPPRRLKLPKAKVVTSRIAGVHNARGKGPILPLVTGYM